MIHPVYGMVTDYGSGWLIDSMGHTQGCYSGQWIGDVGILHEAGPSH